MDHESVYSVPLTKMRKNPLKPPRPFVVEFKRRRKPVAAAKASIWPDPMVFQEFVDEKQPVMADAERPFEPESAAKPVGRIHVVGELAKAPTPDVESEIVSANSEPARQAPVRVKRMRKAPLATETQLDDVVTPVMPDIASEGDVPISAPGRFQKGRHRKTRRWLSKEPPIFPAGQRWKRRLPKALW